LLKTAAFGAWIANAWRMLRHRILLGILFLFAPVLHAQNLPDPGGLYEFNGSHVHLTNYMAYLSLPPQVQACFDPMITAFNPTDMYAPDHIRRVLRTFPGLFSGIGEFTIHYVVASPTPLKSEV
jgi:hypothetical protein